MIDTLATSSLKMLRQSFLRQGHDLRFVGGCVRDSLLGVQPKDKDLATDATPEEQIKVYAGCGWPHWLTGVEHGTITVRMSDGETVEVTSLRHDVKGLGRQAEVAFTRDWLADLKRRDLTINAMMLTFDGELIDPYGGEKDLRAGVVRFVGDAGSRMQEDYLRILRWLRFHGRFSKSSRLDREALRAVKLAKEGLKTVSKERIWDEVAKIVSDDSGPDVMHQIAVMGLLEDLPSGPALLSTEMRRVCAMTRDPVVRLTAWLGRHVLPVGEAWRWSNQEKDLARFLVAHGGVCTLSGFQRLLALDLAPSVHVEALALYQSRPSAAREIANWTIPVCPVTGDDLKAMGMVEGRDLGARLKAIRTRWADSQYTLNSDQLLDPAHAL